MTATWASPRRALLYCTFNGVANCTNGIGRQTKTLLSVADRRWPELTAETGPFDLHLACPQPSPATWAYNPADLAEAERVAGQRGGAVHSLCYDTSKAFWSVDTWRALCKAAAEVILDLADRYDHILAIGPVPCRRAAGTGGPCGRRVGGTPAPPSGQGRRRDAGRPAPHGTPGRPSGPPG
ncbi:MAG: hypothetical protein ACRDYX_16180 [Egibacteraceae bacterium]